MLSLDDYSLPAVKYNWPVKNYGHVMSRKVSYLKQAKLFSSKSFLNFCDPSSRFLINWFLIKKTTCTNACNLLHLHQYWVEFLDFQELEPRFL